MPSGKELEQLPMSHSAPGMGKDKSPLDRKSLNSFVEEVRAMPSKVGKENRTNS